eukprot:TRINITY_DN62582_c0_g1_i1.p1 TRINITY_DN62582_c0_g1~~TRINITY_DN62582_c0_g1_i1.p1  ORF type:complete len:478 (-),score=132.44 TRINITY_DN62582_c0_g1_i1:80-1423(-)
MSRRHVSEGEEESPSDPSSDKIRLESAIIAVLQDLDASVSKSLASATRLSKSVKSFVQSAAITSEMAASWLNLLGVKVVSGSSSPIEYTMDALPHSLFSPFAGENAESSFLFTPSRSFSRRLSRVTPSSRRIGSEGCGGDESVIHDSKGEDVNTSSFLSPIVAFEDRGGRKGRSPLDTSSISSVELPSPPKTTSFHRSRLMSSLDDSEEGNVEDDGTQKMGKNRFQLGDTPTLSSPPKTTRLKRRKTSHDVSSSSPMIASPISSGFHENDSSVDDASFDDRKETTPIMSSPPRTIRLRQSGIGLSRTEEHENHHLPDDADDSNDDANDDLDELQVRLEDRLRSAAKLKPGCQTDLDPKIAQFQFDLKDFPREYQEGEGSIHLIQVFSAFHSQLGADFETPSLDLDAVRQVVPHLSQLEVQTCIDLLVSRKHLRPFVAGRTIFWRLTH